VRQLFRSEDGVALPVASGMLLVISILVVGFFSVSLRVNDTSVEDRSSKRALAAAEAGLQMAVYRLNQLNGTDESIRQVRCLTGTTTPAWVLPTAGECPAVPESLGNGAQYTYHVTHEGGAAGCVEHPDLVPVPADDRCITSTGTVNGVSRRVQARVISRPLVPNFGSTGLVGKSLVYAWNSINLTTNVGSNELVKFENSVNVHDNPALGVDGSILLLSGGEYDEGNGVNVDGNGGNPVEVTVPFDMPVPNFEAVESYSANDTDLLPDSVFEGGAAQRHLRRFKLGNSAIYTMAPGTYHFCNVELGNSVKLRFTHAGGQPTRIYVDSPSRPGSVCAGQADPAGTFGADNSVEINKEVSEREELLEVYLYGTEHNDTRSAYSWCADLNGGGLEGECKSDFMLDNSVDFYGSVYAPNSTVQAHNSVDIFGSIASDGIRFYNSINFQLTLPAIDDRIIPASAAERKGWTECRPERTVSTDPESGC
jgi:hypothetical protein